MKLSDIQKIEAVEILEEYDSEILEHILDQVDIEWLVCLLIAPEDEPEYDEE